MEGKLASSGGVTRPLVGDSTVAAARRYLTSTNEHVHASIGGEAALSLCRCGAIRISCGDWELPPK